MNEPKTKTILFGYRRLIRYRTIGFRSLGTPVTYLEITVDTGRTARET